MTDGATELHDPDVISKSEFARRRNVAPARVTQWINAGQIKGAAIVGEGRGARIRESVACQQLNRSLDVSQRFGNGLSTRLDTPLLDRLPGQSAVSELTTGTGSTNTVQDQIAEQKLIEIKRRNEREEIQLLAETKALMPAREAKQIMGRQISSLIVRIEGGLAGMATNLASQFHLQQRDVLHVLRQEFRTIRSTIAQELKAQAAGLPETIDLDVDSISAAADGGL